MHSLAVPKDSHWLLHVRQFSGKLLYDMWYFKAPSTGFLHAARQVPLLHVSMPVDDR